MIILIFKDCGGGFVMQKKYFALFTASILCCSMFLSGQASNQNYELKKMSPSIKVAAESFIAQPTAYRPAQIKHAYGLDKIAASGKNQKIAIVVAYGSPTIQKDLNSFNAQFGLESANLKIFYPQGKPSTNDTGWAQETSLDVEWAHAIASKATIYLVVAKSAATIDLLGAVDYASNLGVQVVSMSWGASEFPAEVRLDSHFKHANTVYVAASGDYGAGTYWPAVSPNVLAVGGTSLPLDSLGNLKGNETAWSGSGGGISKYESEPSYQQKANIKSNYHRAVPDVALSSDPNYGVLVNYNSRWYRVGGTSFAAPVWAAFIALADGSRATPLSNVHNQLYSLATSSKYSSNFRDITIGQNGAADIYHAKKGYDMVTGLGTPLGKSLFTSMTAK